MDKLDKYIDKVAKLLHDAKKLNNWGLSSGFINGKMNLVNGESDTKEILNTISLLTPDEFDKLTKGLDNLPVKELKRINPYDVVHEENGIYFEECNPMDAMNRGRKYSVVKDNKKMSVTVNTKNDKRLNVVIVERQEDGLYLYSSAEDEIRLISSEELKRLCDNWRNLLRDDSNGISDDAIIDGLTYSGNLTSLIYNGELLANRISSSEKIDETRVNFLFNTGIKEYMAKYSPRVIKEYEEELDEVRGWQR